MNRLKALLQYPLPHHLISRLVYFLTRLKHPMTALQIRVFSRLFRVNLEEAANTDLNAFSSFNEFFTRALKAGARPAPANLSIPVWPADGHISQLGAINQSTLIQAKNHTYDVAALLGETERAEAFASGSFVTVYLSPRDYHRVHLPIAGNLTAMTHICGRLFSVAPHTVDNVPSVFARNERVVAHFDTDQGALAVVLVGALNVGAIDMLWHGPVTPLKTAKVPGLIWTRRLSTPKVTHWRYNENDVLSGESAENSNTHSGAERSDPVTHNVAADAALPNATELRLSYARGDEIGRFNMGSTVIILSQKRIDFDGQFTAGSAVQLGSAMGQYP